MNIFCSVLLSTLFCMTALFAGEAEINPKLLKNRWDAWWIAHASARGTDYGVQHFRKSIVLAAKPDKYIIHVSADNRYRLYVNARSVSTGPSRWDLAHWRYETIDIAPFLKPGKNDIAAVVWNGGQEKPVFQFSHRTAFILQGDTDQEAMVNTDSTWKVFDNRAYAPIPVTPGTLKQYVAIGPCERMDGARYPWGWLHRDYDDSHWSEPELIDHGKPRGLFNANSHWLLTPRQIPAMEETLQRFPLIRSCSGMEAEPGFLQGNKPLTVPARSHVRLLLDQGHLTTAYPEMLVSGGKEAVMKMSYAEAMMTQDLQKIHRDSVENLKLWGYGDEFIFEGGAKRYYSPLWFRTFRYVELDIRTEAEPLVIHDFSSFYTGYPFEEKATFSASDASLGEIWQTGWRTARLCAGETYYDCPYYEQLQYVGDTRIQALISLYVTGDDRLMRKAIELFNDSRTPDGLTASRYPTNLPQVIPPYSLFWVSMIHDYWMHCQDEEFVRSFLIGIQGVLDWYERRLDRTGLLGPMEWWNFVDWPDEWAWDPVKDIGGVPDGARDGHSAIITMQYIYVLKQAAELFDAFDRPVLAGQYRRLIAAQQASLKALCWDEKRQLFADTPEKSVFSQHANVTAVLADLIPEEQKSAFVRRVVFDQSLIQCTFYYRFYLIQAVKKAGLADLYLELLQPWRDMLAIGLTTFAERQEPTRSDCHAWSASPNYDFLATVCGIEPDSPGFKTVRIRPAMGALKWLQVKMPHPQGEISLRLQRDGEDSLKGMVRLPANVTGIFIWQGREIRLCGGEQQIVLERDTQ